jgi:hypothetical protein
MLVLRHENAVLRRQAGRVRYEPVDRAWFAALARIVSHRRWVKVFPVTPATLLAWHRSLAAGKYDTSGRRRPGRPVGALGSCCANPSLGIAVRARCSRRRLHYLHALTTADLIEGAGELGVAVPDEEAEGCGPGAEIHEEVAGLLGCPCAVRMSGHPQDVHAPRRHLHDEQYVQPRTPRTGRSACSQHEYGERIKMVAVADASSQPGSKGAASDDAAAG